MAVCSGCRAPVTGNFCADCGAPSHHTQLDPILLDSTGPVTATSSDSVRSGSRRRGLVLGAVILLAICAGGLLLSRTSDDVANSAEQDADDIVAQTTTSTRPSSTATSDAIDGQQESKWFVVVQTNEGIVRVDAVTGEKEDLGLDGSLLGEAWGRVLIRRLNGNLQFVAIDALGGKLPIEGTMETDGSTLGSGSRVIQGVESGLAWIVSDFNETAWQVDLSSGGIVRTVQLDQSAWFDVSPDFRTPAAGGIYALQDDDSYRIVLDGRIVAEAPGRILVNRCDEALSCRNQWIDPDSFEELPQFYMPDTQIDGWFPRGLGNGRFLSINSEAVDSLTGETLRLENLEVEAVWDRRVGVSPDSKFVAMQVRNGKLRIRSVDGTKTVSADGVSSGGWDNTPVFVPRTVD